MHRKEGLLLGSWQGMSVVIMDPWCDPDSCRSTTFLVAPCVEIRVRVSISISVGTSTSISVRFTGWCWAGLGLERTTRSPSLGVHTLNGRQVLLVR